jgi:hypothetical protein
MQLKALADSNGQFFNTAQHTGERALVMHEAGNHFDTARKPHFTWRVCDISLPFSVAWISMQLNYPITVRHFST